MSTTFSQTCICGHIFTDISAFSRHEKGCKKGKKRLSSALERARAIYQNKRTRMRYGGDQDRDIRSAQEDDPFHSTPESGSVCTNDMLCCASCTYRCYFKDNAPLALELPPDDDGRSLAQRRTRRPNRRLPLHFRDLLPEPPMPLPPAQTDPEASLSMPSSSSVQTCLQSVWSSLCRMFKTQLNKFGLYCVYHTTNLPTHDPDDPYAIEHQPAAPAVPVSHVSENPYHPYPNQNSFRLGEWYWNQGTRTSKESFKKLLDIVGNAEYRPEDIQDMNWRAIDCALGGNSREGCDSEWVDKDDNWRCTPVSISVPFHSRSQYPGPKNYVVGDFHHRSLVSIIREKLSDPEHDRLFHYEPYELRWQSPYTEKDVQVHGELFTSDAFIQAHQKLQDSPPEPGCDLPKVVAAFMFWSDSTQLSSFGNAKLWPLYLCFGNESKYHRCQPANNLCTHVAYFQTVRSSHCWQRKSFN